MSLICNWIPSYFQFRAVQFYRHLKLIKQYYTRYIHIIMQIHVRFKRATSNQLLFIRLLIQTGVFVCNPFTNYVPTWTVQPHRDWDYVWRNSLKQFTLSITTCRAEKRRKTCKLHRFEAAWSFNETLCSSSVLRNCFK